MLAIVGTPVTGEGGRRFAAWLKEYLEDHELLPSDFTRLITTPERELSQSYVTRWLGGQAPRPDLCHLIAAQLDLDPSFVLYQAGHLPEPPVIDVERDHVVRQLMAQIDRLDRADWPHMVAVVRSVTNAMGARHHSPEGL